MSAPTVGPDRARLLFRQATREAQDAEKAARRAYAAAEELERFVRGAPAPSVRTDVAARALEHTKELRAKAARATNFFELAGKQAALLEAPQAELLS